MTATNHHAKAAAKLQLFFETAKFWGRKSPRRSCLRLGLPIYEPKTN